MVSWGEGLGLGRVEQVVSWGEGLVLGREGGAGGELGGGVRLVLKDQV